MFVFNGRNHTITSTAGGYWAGGLQIRDTYVALGFNMHGVLYEPVLPVEQSQIGVICFHSDDDYSTFPIGGGLAKRGYRVLCGQIGDPNATLDQKMLNIKKAVSFMRGYPGITKIVLLGHSGGATLMSAYQAAAEHGVGIFQPENMLIKCSIQEELPAADGMLMLDANWGNGAMTLLSIDPAVMDEDSGLKLDPELDMFDPVNGYDPEGSVYSEDFLNKFYAAQGARNNAIVARALERLHAIESGKGRYSDDEPFIVPGGAQYGPCNKIFPQDIRLLNHTKRAYPLLHKDGSATDEVIHSVRRARGGRSETPGMFACVVTTVRSYLTNRAVLAGKDYLVKPDCIEGIQWENTYNCPPGNVRHISVPLLVMGMTGSYEYLAAEAVYDNAASSDRSIAFVEGAGHMFHNQGREEFGDTQKIVFDHVDQWLRAAGRFLD